MGWKIQFPQVGNLVTSVENMRFHVRLLSVLLVASLKLLNSQRFRGRNIALYHKNPG